jgi:hypothetical protein
MYGVGCTVYDVMGPHQHTYKGICVISPESSAPSVIKKAADSNACSSKLIATI